MNKFLRLIISYCMIKFDFKGCIYGALFDIKDHLHHHKKHYIVFSTIILIGLITGMLTAFKFAGNITLDNLSDKVIKDFLSNDIGAFMILIRRIFWFALLFIILYIINIKRFTCFLNYILILYEAYLLGLNSAIFIALFNISGIINVFIVYLPCHLLMLISMMMIATVFCSSCFAYKRFGETIFCPCFWQEYSKSIITILCLTLFAIILETILLPTFCNVFFII